MCGRHSLLTKRDGHKVHGVGLVEKSLDLNLALDSFEIWDINQQPQLAIEQIFQAAVMTFGLNYLTQPLEVLQAVRSLLTPDARLIVVCAKNCYEPDKAASIWNHVKKQTEAGQHFRDQIDLTMDLLSRSGFQIIHAKELSQHYHLSYDSFMVVGEKS